MAARVARAVACRLRRRRCGATPAAGGRGHVPRRGRERRAQPRLGRGGGSGATRRSRGADRRPRHRRGGGRQRPGEARRGAAADHRGGAGCRRERGARAVARAEASAAEAEQTYRRYAALAGGQFVSKLQLDQARAARDAAVAVRDAARAGVAQAAQQAGYTLVRAPFDGVVSRRDVEAGETVAPGQALMGVYAPGALRIEVAVPQTAADAIRRDPRAQVRLPDGRGVAPAEVVVFPVADAASHSVNVRVSLPTLDPPLAPGTTAKVVFAADAPEGDAAPLRIPASAVAQRGELSGVYVKQGERLLLRQLRLGSRIGDQVEVISGLQPGDAVARDPVAALQALEAQRKAAEGDHG
ncbi:MAG: efflux RND transporter periplasmic adaptor subunit [Lysobacterales bacterium]